MMNSQQLKLQLEDIVNPQEILLLRSIECPIDNMIPLDSLAVVCKKCETVYCKDCIDVWKRTNNICPMRCQPMELIPVEKTILASQLELIKIKCKYEQYGCIEKILIKDQKSHEKNCKYKQTECFKCNLKLSEGFLVSHLLEECDSLRIKCFICNNKYQMNKLDVHIAECIEKSYLCKSCGDYHLKSESNSDKVCKLLIEICPKCKLPELKNILNPTEHNCLSNKYKDNQIAISNYLLHLSVKIEIQMEKKLKDMGKCYLTFENEVFEVIKLLEKKFSNKQYVIDKKYQKIEDDSVKKIIVRNQSSSEEITKIEKSISELCSIIDSKLLNIVRINYIIIY
jgi:hypothetical protein